MRIVGVGVLVISLGIGATAGADSAGAAMVPTQVDLGTLGGNNSYPVAINNAGQIAGWSNPTGSTDAHAFRWDAAHGMTDLGTLGGPSSAASAMNNAGQVVGTSPTAASHTHGFLWDATNGIVDLGTLGGADTTTPLAINDSGLVVGSSTFSGTLKHAFVWDATNGMVDLGTLGGTESTASAVNNSGQVVGWAQTTGNAATHAFVWDATNGMVDLGTIGGNLSAAQAISDLGQIAGITSVSSTGGTHAFRWDPGVGMIDLGTTGNSTNGFVVEVVGVSDAGVVAGWGFDPIEQARVFVASPTDGFAEIDTGDSLAVANGVNASGQVVGSTFSGSGAEHAFIGDRVHGTLRLGSPSVDSRALAINDSGQAAGRVLTGVGSNEHAVTWAPTFGHTVSVATAAVVEGDTGGVRTITFAVTLSDPSTTQITVPYSFANSLSPNAASSADWKGRRGVGTLVFKPSASTGLTPTTRYVSASVTADAVSEADEVFVVMLGTPSGGYQLGNSVVTAKILDDDPAVDPPQVSVGDVSIWEGDTGAKNVAKVWVTLDRPAAAAATVAVSVGGGSASSPSDYKAFSKTLRFAVGQRQKSISVSVTPDGQQEVDETVSITLSNPTGGLHLARSSGTLTILNDDS